jgi:hypothetical protein
MTILWFVVYFGGKVAETIGPLPYSMNTCNYIVSTFYDGGERTYITTGGKMLHDVDFSCEEHLIAPKVGSDDNRPDKIHHY